MGQGEEEATALAQQRAGPTRTSGWVSPDTCPLTPAAPPPRPRPLPLLHEQRPGPPCLPAAGRETPCSGLRSQGRHPQSSQLLEVHPETPLH